MGDLKKKIQETQGHAAESQKLIYSGMLSSILWNILRLLSTRQGAARLQDGRIM